MFQFNKDQQIFDIAGVKVGGQPGQLPTVLLGSIFYHKEKLVEDAKKAKFDKEAAEKLLKQEEALSDETGNPSIVDVCCAWPQAFPKFIEFVANTIDGAFAIDGTTPEVRITGAKYAAEVGLSERIVYNSITPHTKDEEITALKESKIRSAILLTLNVANPTLSGRLEVIDEALSIANKAGIQNILVDATVLDIPDPGPVSKAIYLIKEKYGLPAGGGLHNAMDRWRERGKLESDEYKMGTLVANIFPIVMGANFILYGPIERASNIYFSCGLADAYVAYNMVQEYGKKPLVSNHPLMKIFKDR
jgi:tetrahydromethanopterin S-methyltransferase subunit H